VVPPIEQFAADMASDESGSASDQYGLGHRLPRQ
jgi:hypothetical protein